MNTLHPTPAGVHTDTLRDLITFALATGWRPTTDMPAMSDEARDRPTVPAPGGAS
ncbi:MAG TPA: hypothetical protein VE987_15955 [Polyangiaceae bacterium]|nr:hypothetical protein [Polyangiaceae bacterium]